MTDPDFSAVQIASRNGSISVCHVVKGRSFQMRGRKLRKRVRIDFDMHCGNHNITEEASSEFAECYKAYLDEKQVIVKRYTSITHKVVLIEVLLADAEEWFSKAFKLVSNLVNLERIRVPEVFGQSAEYHPPQDLLLTEEKVEEGEVVRVNPAAFSRFIDDLVLDFEILIRMAPRDFERAIAAVCSRTGRFDRVILTPRSGDQGRDIILEATEWGGSRRIIELKRYRRLRVDAEKVNALLGVLTGEAEGSVAALLTTSEFAPRIQDHRSIREAVNSQRLRLVELVELVEGCIQSEYCSSPLHFAEL